jgi:hypothetical protein
MLIKIEIEIQIDPIPGWGNKPEDFVEQIKATIPDYYLKSVKLVAPEVDVPVRLYSIRYETEE